MTSMSDVVEAIVAARRSVPASRSVLAAVTGIDGCGKGYVTARIAQSLRKRGLRVAAIDIDGWLNLPKDRFSDVDPAPHFYRNAIRFAPLFHDIVLPLRDTRSVRVEADFGEETATAFRKRVYAYSHIDVVVLEGIYLLKRELRAHYDLSCWIECTFDTALARAIARAQEGLSPEATVAAYRTIYFPAQEIHFARDDPRAAATAILNNDPRLQGE